MEADNIQIQIKCAFCGELNLFSKGEIYGTDQKGEKLKEKFCTYCGEPLIVKCEVCNTTFSLTENLQNNPVVKEADSFWTPLKSPIDDLIPKLEENLENFKNIAGNLKEQDFILRQKDFLENLKPLKDKADSLRPPIIELSKLENLSHFSKDFSKVLKQIDNIQTEIEDIESNIDPEFKAVKEKKAKQLKKHVIFLDIVPEIEDLIQNIQELRKLEITKEKEGLAPGFNKIFSNLAYDPSFYRIICPNCNTITYFIQKQLYKWDKTQNRLQFIKELPRLTSDDNPDTGGFVNLTLNVHIHLEFPKIYDLHGNTRLVLDSDSEETIGRDFLREIDYDEPESESVLYDSKDPLGWISRKQFSLLYKDNAVFIKAMSYDARRVGTFLNDLSTDIRLVHPDGVKINSGDKVLIPLVNEKNNPNLVSISFEIDK